MDTLAKKPKTHQKTQENNNLLKTKRILNINMSAKGGPAITFCLPVRDRQFRH